MTITQWTRIAVGLAAGVCLSRPLPAQEEKILGWAGEAGLSFVAVDGNAQSQALGFHGKWVDTLPQGALVFETGGHRAETTSVTRFAVFTPGGDFELREVENSDLTAENYFLRGRYDREIRPDLVWFVGAGWERNTFAGFDSRAVALFGLGKTWVANGTTRFRTDAGLTYTQEEPSSPGIESDSFAGVRLGWDFEHQFSPSTKLTNQLALDPSLEESEDWRADDLTALTVSMTERLALQLGLRLLYDNQPALERVELILPNDDRRFFIVERDDLDTTFTTSLVWKF